MESQFQPGDKIKIKRECSGLKKGEIAPLWEDNCNGYLNVCICGNCELPTLEKLAKDFRLNLHSKDKDGVIKPLFEILNNPKE